MDAGGGASRAPARACHACLLRAEAGRSLNARSSWRRICDECSQSYLTKPLLVPIERVRICPDTVGAWGQSREIYQAWDLPGAVVPARKYRLPALQGKVAVVFQDEANAETVDLLLGPLSLKPEKPFVLRYCSSIKSFCASDCFGSPKDKSCLAHIKQRTKRGGLNDGSVYGLDWPCGDAKRKRPNPDEFGARWIQSCEPCTGAPMYVQANKDMHLKEPFGPKGPPCVPMPYKWMATPQPGARAQGIGYPFHASSLSAPVPHASPDQLGSGAVHPFGAPAQEGSAGGSAAHGPSVHPDAQPLPPALHRHCGLVPHEWRRARVLLWLVMVRAEPHTPPRRPVLRAQRLDDRQPIDQVALAPRVGGLVAEQQQIVHGEGPPRVVLVRRVGHHPEVPRPLPPGVAPEDLRGGRQREPQVGAEDGGRQAGGGADDLLLGEG